MRLFLHFRRSLWNALFANNGLLVAKAASYSAIVSVFPGMIVLAAIVAKLPAAENLRHSIFAIISQFLPANITRIIGNYFEAHTRRTVGVIITAAIVSFFAASGVAMSLMEGFRRAYGLPPSAWGFWRQRLIAFALVPLSLVPLFAAANFVIFGRIIMHWIAARAGHDLGPYVLVLWLVVRWSAAMLASIGVLMVMYWVGLPKRPAWKDMAPGALVATLIWFPFTLLFGWYVTRYANYSAVYGSLGAGIALLAWLYILCVSALIGAEFNAAMLKESIWSEPALATANR
jgi:membrane protein